MDVNLVLRRLLIKAKAGVARGKPIVTHTLKRRINLNPRASLESRAGVATQVPDNRRLT